MTCQCFSMTNGEVGSYSSAPTVAKTKVCARAHFIPPESERREMAMSSGELGTAVQERAPQPGAHEKTPVQLLNEYCVRIGAAAPAYVWSKQGNPFDVGVTCTVTVGDVTGTGEGTRKQTAKQSAAAAAWAHIQPNAAPRQAPPKAPDFISTLQEDAVKRGRPAPLYQLVEECGEPHDRQFTMSCQYDGFEGTATGPSKKIAKHGAASKVLAQLHQARQQQGGAGLQEDGVLGCPVEDTAPPSLASGSPSVSNGV